jgi:hypothetical protein
MIIIGCDFHTRYQQIAMAREETGEVLVERRLDHESGEAYAFYRSLQSSQEPVRVGGWPHLDSVKRLWAGGSPLASTPTSIRESIRGGPLRFCFLQRVGLFRDQLARGQLIQGAEAASEVGGNALTAGNRGTKSGDTVPMFPKINDPN